MADLAKKNRTQCLKQFTRNANILREFLDQESPSEIVGPQHEKFVRCWDKLEEAHEAFISVTEMDDNDTDKDGFPYLDDPGKTYKDLMVLYSTYIKQSKQTEKVVAEEDEKQRKLREKEERRNEEEERKAVENLRIEEERAAKVKEGQAELELMMRGFKRLCGNLKNSLENASALQKKVEWDKVEKEFSGLKEKLVHITKIDPSVDITAIRDTFETNVQDEYLESQKWILGEIRDVPNTSGGRNSLSKTTSTKKEAVKLPFFKGAADADPFLQFPIWKASWDKLILEYDEDWRDNLLRDHIDSVALEKFAGYEHDYKEAMKRLESFYADPVKVVSCIVNEVNSQSPVPEGNYHLLVKFSDVLSRNYARLTNLGLEHELSNTSAMYSIVRKFPRNVGEKWTEYISGQAQVVRSKPFPAFIQWIATQRPIWEQMGVTVAQGESSDMSFFASPEDLSVKKKCYGCQEEGHIRKDCPKSGDVKNKVVKPREKPKIKKYWCAYHKEDPKRKCFSNSCQDLRRMADVKQRIKLLNDNKDCFHCCGDHLPEDCPQKERVCGGGKENRGCTRGHKVHELFCQEAAVCMSVVTVHSAKTKEGVVLSIMQVRTVKGRMASVFFDGGCTANFIREAFARACNFPSSQKTLLVTTLGDVVSDYKTVTYFQCTMVDEDGKWQSFEAYGIESITGAVSQIGLSKLQSLFPQISNATAEKLMRLNRVDILIGICQASWHPQRAERAVGGGDLWIYRGMFGCCVGGRHPELLDLTKKREKNLFTVVETYHIKASSTEIVNHELEDCPSRMLEFKKECRQNILCSSSLIMNDKVPAVEAESLLNASPQDGAGSPSVIWDDKGVETSRTLSDNAVMCIACHARVCALPDEKDFFQGESLGVVVNPLCGACKCSKCPIPGAKFSFSEQQQLDVINSNLFYDEELGAWATELPWRVERSTLPRNEKSALQNLLSHEHRLDKVPGQAEDWINQIQQMVERGAAVVLSDEEIRDWNGDFHYLPMVGVKGKKGKGWLRVWFDASRRQNGYPSMNDCLYKGPDKFINNILGVIICFRNGRVGFVSDISKFHNQVRLIKKDMHMQRFMWRSMNTDQKPEVYAVTRNNFGVKPANCIATCALHKSADKFADVYPVESQELKDQSYVDDLLMAAENGEQAMIKASHVDEILAHADMRNKGWLFSGDQVSSTADIGNESAVLEAKVLGMKWIPPSDSFVFDGEVTVEVTVELKIVEADGKETGMTRRIVMSFVARIFDPAGLLAPLLLEAKLLIRESWCVADLGWDDTLPTDQAERWSKFFASLSDLKEIHFPRSLWPEEEVVGLPVLIIFSDGSKLAFGAVAYIRWQLRRGGFWSRIIMAKCKIAPKHLVSIPRMELCGALVGNRMKNFLIKSTNIKFSKTYQFVDSSTVLGYLYKQCGAFKPYEGLKVAEIQASNVFVDGKLVGFAWVRSEDNPADWCTKSHPAIDLAKPFWQNGASFLQEEESSWPIRTTYRVDRLEGEIQLKPKVICGFINIGHPDYLERLLNRGSCWKRILRVGCWMLRLPKRECKSKVLLSKEINEAKLMLVKFSQKEMTEELREAAELGKGRYRKLAPELDQDGVYRVGSRMKHHVPFTFDSKMPVIVPPKHRLTTLVMEDCHKFSHAGQDGTVSRFRACGFWTIGAGRVAKCVKNNCVPCRKISGKPSIQPCGDFPPDRLLHPVAWGHCQLDMVGPYSCRGDVNPRTTKKTWGLVIEDVNSGGVYIDVVSDYSTNAVLATMRRFGSLRGWPGVIYSDPGSQLESASGKLESWWLKMHTALVTFAGSKSFRWETSPADSPWRQGKVERRIAIIKKHVKLAIGDTRITPLELQTVFFEISNICNERPITISKPRDDGSYSLVTPNQLLLGRSCNQLPDDSDFTEDLPVAARYRLINHVTSAFWQRWSSDVSPALIVRQKWHETSRNLQVGDVVMIVEPTKLKAKYKMGIIADVKVSRDGKIRSAVVRYNNINSIDNKQRVTPVHVTRSVQRLVLILPVEEQSTSLMINDDDRHLEVSAHITTN